MNKSKSSISVIVQNGLKPPRHYWLSKGIIRKIGLSFGLLFIVFSSASIGLGLYYFTDKLSFLSEKNQFKNRISELEVEISSLKDKWDEERIKLQTIALESQVENFPDFQLIKTIKGQKDLRNSLITEIDELKVSKKENNLEVSFNLTNQSNQNRISGYLFVIYTNGPYSQYYPKIKDSNDIKFFNGEFFSIARFRVTKIKYAALSEEDPTFKEMLKIVIFSRSGELLYLKNFDTENL
ncbi:MAG: hypothetical protein CME61_06385 [Halobacteriovoraceae bacterium]|nr:hypothetical protein [Halobacteriovoraceae bacterium]|tara:strand:+ start:195 stop:908 length:714 start_codon:yes stop_codon:yes gene_type:complete